MKAKPSGNKRGKKRTRRMWAVIYWKYVDSPHVHLFDAGSQSLAMATASAKWLATPYPNVVLVPVEVPR